MITEIKNHNVKIEKFPKLMISKQGLILLAIGYFQETIIKGTIVFKEENSDIARTIGEYSNNWAIYEFSDFNGELILSND